MQNLIFALLGLLSSVAMNAPSLNSVVLVFIIASLGTVLFTLTLKTIPAAKIDPAVTWQT